MQHDLNQAAKYAEYETRHIRPLRFFQNSRINTAPTLTLSDIFTGRALRNIDLIIESIPPAPANLRRALLLTLTASIGQMSSMVFAITGRGKTTGEGTGRPLTLEVRPFEDIIVRQGQPIGKIRFERVAEIPEVVYDAIASNYLEQYGPRLAKHFKRI